jgi:hypothetical protein
VAAERLNGLAAAAGICHHEERRQRLIGLVHKLEHAREVPR